MRHWLPNDDLVERLIRFHGKHRESRLRRGLRLCRHSVGWIRRLLTGGLGLRWLLFMVVVIIVVACIGIAIAVTFHRSGWPLDWMR